VETPAQLEAARALGLDAAQGHLLGRPEADVVPAGGVPEPAGTASAGTASAGTASAGTASAGTASAGAMSAGAPEDVLSRA
jgi:probable phosphoglycerate mutase